MIMIKIYGLVSDNGDGSASVHWFKNDINVEQLMEDDVETWGMNEGYPAEILTFPDGFDFDTCGITFYDGEFCVEESE